MNYEIIVKPTFERQAKKLQKRYTSFKSDFATFLDELYRNPETGTDLGGGLRKYRMKITAKNKGKRGGARVLSFTVIVSEQDAQLNLIFIYDKSERESITKKEIESLLKNNGFAQY